MTRSNCIPAWMRVGVHVQSMIEFHTPHLYGKCFRILCNVVLENVIIVCTHDSIQLRDGLVVKCSVLVALAYTAVRKPNEWAGPSMCAAR
jgi:hypothetical protein